jgi:hypothetical protein
MKISQADTTRGAGFSVGLTDANLGEVLWG